MKHLEIRDAMKDDAGLILKFIKDLATYERAAHEVIATVNDIESSLFGEQSTVQSLICSLNNEPIGYAVYFYNYSTWLGRKGLYLEDLYVTPEYRGNGAGRKILHHLARKAVAEGCGRFEWSVLDWNEPAIEFYQSIGAKPKEEWVIYQLTGNSLQRFADI